MTDEEHSLMVATYLRLNQIVDNITSLNMGSSLTWVWVWDIIKGEIKEGVDEDKVFAQLWKDADKAGFSLEYGTESLHEHITDWLIAHNFHEESDEEEDND